jgi:hypothetical protein
MGRFAACVYGFAFGTIVHVATASAQVDDFYDVDLELAIGVDVSRSMDAEELRVQRDGYISAFRHPDIVAAIRSLPLGRIAVTYFEWAGPGDRVMVASWTTLASAEDANAFANRIAVAPSTRESGTSISGAMFYAWGLFGRDYRGYRRALDISGDGPNNAGLTVVQTRDWLVAQGVTINGLPILINRPAAFGPFGIPNLDVYYEDCVIGGPGAFVIPVNGLENFAEAVRRKLVLEITGLPARVVPAAVKIDVPRVDCEIGEKSRRGWQYLDRSR